MTAVARRPVAALATALVLAAGVMAACEPREPSPNEWFRKHGAVTR